MDVFNKPSRSRLSTRQRQCLDRVGQGYTSKEIGRQLGLSPSTVDSHIRAALERLNMSDRAEAARFVNLGRDLEVDKEPAVVATDPVPRSFFRLPPLGGSVDVAFGTSYR
jgi:DNA-binding CsgD family transcriptional regulator